MPASKTASVVAEVELSQSLLDKIENLARQLRVSEEQVLTSSVKLMEGVAEGRYEVTELNGASSLSR